MSREINLPTVELYNSDKNSMNVEKVITFCRLEEIAETCCVNTKKVAFANLSLNKEIYCNDSHEPLQIYMSPKSARIQTENSNAMDER